MTASLNAAPSSVQARLEAISMRLDAATDSLMQTRDLIIKHLEQQMLQLQDVRGALHETALESLRPEAKEPPPPVKPVEKLALKSLFAPLNAAKPTPKGAFVDVEPLAPEEGFHETGSADELFESEPVPAWETAPDSPPGLAVEKVAVLEAQPAMAAGLAVAGRSELDPELEKATLDELNEALTRAFAQIAGRSGR